MSSTQIDKVLNVFKRINGIPSLTSARIIPSEKNGLKVLSVWSQRIFDVRRAKVKFTRNFVLSPSLEPVCEFPSSEVSDLLTAWSEDGKLRAVLREETVDGKTKQSIEIWDEVRVTKAYDLSVYDVHGDVYVEPTFGAFHWSPDKTRLLYVAEKKLPKSESFTKQKPKTKPKSEDDDEKPSRGTEYVYKPDWGEQLVGKHRSVVVVLNTKDDTITPVASIPDDCFPGQVIWARNGEDIIGVAYKLNTRYLGLYACTNRESCIFHVKGSEFNKLTAEGLYCSAPRLSPDGKHLVWLERELSPAHHSAERLMRVKLDSTENPDKLVDLVKKHVLIADDKKFYGLYNHFLPKRCWSDDSKHIFLSTPQRSTIKSYTINLETKEMREIESSDGSSLIIADVKQNVVVFHKLSMIQPSQLVVGKFNPAASIVENLKIISDSGVNDNLSTEGFFYEHNEFVYNTDEPVKNFIYTYFGKQGGPDQSVPVIVALHGGPHAVYCNEFYETYALLGLLGFAVLLVNYRGSTGAGSNTVDYLLGKVGEVDVRDCMAGVEDALRKYTWLDSKRVSLYGGSHGGFLAAHLSGQHPDKFKAAVLLNPVIDMASMFAITDIPDWCRAESGCSIFEKLPDDTTDYSKLLTKMVEHSPIIHVDKVKAPTLIALGSKDLRVPMSQGKLWYYRLKANNVVSKLYIYEDNHSLRKDEVRIDNVVNSVLWLMEHNELCDKDEKPTETK